jgi:predicted nucleic acid-binding protein
MVADIAEDGKTIFVPRVVLAEMYVGVYRAAQPDRHKKVLESFVADLQILEITDEVCDAFGMIRARLLRGGDGIGDFDTLIAATCIVHRQPILTANPRHFRKVQGLEVLTYL